VCRNPNSYQILKLPFEVPYISRLGETPYVRYLFPTLFPRGIFYVLTLTKNSARLLQCTRHSVREINLADFGIPTSLERALRYDDLQKPELQHHPTTGPGRSPEGQAATEGGPHERRHVFHGHGESGEGEKTRLQRYFQSLDKGIRSILPSSAPPPLILAGVDHAQALYREVSHYQNLVADPVAGSHDRLSSERIHELARPVMEEQLHGELSRDRERYADASGRGLASAKLEEVLAAAHDGRVDTLFVRWDGEAWGKYDEATRRLVTREQPSASDVELLDQACRWTFQNSGTVYVTQETDMMVDSRAAAIFRY
jgi:hypothetical protein